MKLCVVFVCLGLLMLELPSAAGFMKRLSCQLAGDLGCSVSCGSSGGCCGAGDCSGTCYCYGSGHTDRCQSCTIIG